MKISTFISITNPERHSYPYLQSIESHLLFSDEVIIIDGGSDDGSLGAITDIFGTAVKIVYFNWPQGKYNWTWEQFSKTWNFGYELCSGDWVFAGECDHVFEVSEAKKVRRAIETHGKIRRKALFLDKLVTSTWDLWHNKSKFIGVLNKGEWGDNLGYGFDRNPKQHQDLASPIIINEKETEFGIPAGRLIGAEDGHNMGVRFLNYDKTFKTKSQILQMRDAANWAWNNSCLVKLELEPAWAESNIVEDVVNRMVQRYHKGGVQMSLNGQPENMRKLLSELTEDQLGFNLFGEIK